MLKKSFKTLAFLSILYMPTLWGQYHSYQTINMRLIYYDSSHSYVISHLRRCFENTFGFYRNYFNYKPSQEVTVLLQDFDDYGYAGATCLPINYLVLGIEPFECVYETSPTNERLNWVMNHELMHIVSTDKANSTDNFYRSIFFGKVAPISENPLSAIYSYLTTPRKYCPRWFLEGIAVFYETFMAGGIGRAQSGYDEMVFRTMYRDSSYFYDFVGLESEGTTVDFQIGQNSYLYGTRFIGYLVYEYGLEKLNSWIDRTEDSNRDFASQFSRIYGVSIDEEWSRWITWEHSWQQRNLDSIRTYPVTEFRKISGQPLGAISRGYYDSAGHCIYTAVNYPGQFSYIVSIDIYTGDVKRICEIATPALYYVCHLTYDPANNLIYYTTNNNRGTRDLNVVDIRTKKTRRLLKGCRMGDLTFNRADSSIWGVQHHVGYSTIVVIPPPYSGWINLVKLPYGKDIIDLDISPDGKVLTATVIEISGKQSLVRMSTERLRYGDGTYETLYEVERNSLMNFVHSSDGRYLYGSTYITGVSNIVRYDQVNDKMEWLTNCETGLFRPIPVSADSVITFEYSGRGFKPVVIPNQTTEDVSSINYLGYGITQKHPVVQSLTRPSPLTVNIDSLTTFAGEYNGFSSLKLFSAYPIVDGYKDFFAYGFRVNMMDPLMIHEANLTATYTPNLILPENERIHLSFNYNYWRWKVSLTYNHSDFYDLFGPTKTSRKGYSIGVEFKDYLLYDLPKVMDYSVGLTGWGGLETLPDYQNISASSTRSLTGNAKISYRNLRRSMGGLEAEGGIRSQFVVLDNYVRDRHYPRMLATTDYGFLLPIYHSSVWFRSSLGYSFGKREEPFANFYFGGFGNNWIDHQESKQYRRYNSFPGAEIDAIGGTNFARLMVEWILPPLRFRRFGFPNLYCNWVHFSIFGSTIATNVDDKAYRQVFMNVGSQADWKLVIFSRLESTFSLGYAFAWERKNKPTKEFMFSLKILW